MCRSAIFNFLFCVLALCVLSSQIEAAPQSPSPHAVDIPRWFTESFLDIREDIQDATRQQKRLLIYFGQDGCPYCKALMKVNFGQVRISMSPVFSVSFRSVQIRCVPPAGRSSCGSNALNAPQKNRRENA